MATQNIPLPLLLAKGPLSSLNTLDPKDGRLAIGLYDDNTNQRAKLYIDDNGKRYEFKPSWGEIIDKPELVLATDYRNDKEEYKSDKTTINNSIADKVDIENGTAINLGIAASTAAGASKVQLLYNTITESLDFTFT